MTLSGSMRSFAQSPALLRPARAGHPGTGSGRSQTVTLGGTQVWLAGQNEALQTIMERAQRGARVPLGVASANLDHVKHFGDGGRWAGTMDEDVAQLEWLTLLDGSPLVTQAERITGQQWPRLAGSDLIWPLLDAAAASSLAVGFLGGKPEIHNQIREKLAASHPNLRISGCWAPERSVLGDRGASRALAEQIRAAKTDILVVCLGKPRQELWIAEYGQLTGAAVLLAFGAVIDFLAGRVQRAPEVVRSIHAEWAWRLALEPARLATRYLVDGPEAYVTLRRHSSAGRPGRAWPTAPGTAQRPASPATGRKEGFLPVSEHADVAVLIVTYNNDADVPALLAGLRCESQDQSIKVVVADNSPSPDTRRALAEYPDVLCFATGGNLGYAGAINAAMSRAGRADVYLVLNPDTRVQAGAVAAMRRKMSSTGAGVVVPLLFDEDGARYPSLRREPTVSRAIGDALLGSRFRGRPNWLSEMDFDDESYRYAHPVDWATGAALMISSDTARMVGDWAEEYFLYSEETDFLHRVRDAGQRVWFDPLARMTHRRGGSGTSPELDALMAANRIRYVRKFHTAGYARAFRAAVVLSALLRSPMPRHGGVLSTVASEKRWARLPHATRYVGPAENMPVGAVIIPAHNEAAVLGRTLASLAGPIATGNVEVIVACNGCTDDTAAVARSFPGVRVIEVDQASKVAALNAANRAATRWPRVYLDADIELPADALRETLDLLHGSRAVLCARPAFAYDTTGAGWFVQAYYRARNRLPQASGSMWGAGVYALSEKGFDRIGRFPEVTADDCYVDRIFGDGEKQIVSGSPVLVRTPRTAGALLQTLRRVYRGNSELAGLAGSRTPRTVWELIRTVQGPAAAGDALAYGVFALAGRFALRRSEVWERDDSSRR